MYTLLFPIGTTGLIDAEVYETSQYYDIPIDDIQQSEISFMDACFRFDAEQMASNGSVDLNLY